MEQTMTLTVSEYDRLVESDLKLAALEEAGVDNWSGYSEAMKMLRSWCEDGYGVYFSRKNCE